jgi:glycosyltransferase involved in cell wall biosynthesis
MKILFLSSRYAPHARGGAERVARTLAAGVRDLGNEVVVLTTAGKHEPAERIVDDILVRTIPLRNVYDLSSAAPSAALKPLWHLADSFNLPMQSAVRRVIRDERPDVIHSHLLTGFSASAWAAARAEGVPVVHTLHDHYLLCARSTMAVGGIPCAARHVECAILTQPRMLMSREIAAAIGVSRYVLDRHLEYGAFPNVPTSVIPNPCHLVGLAPPRPVATASVRFGFMARLELSKGIEMLLTALSGMPGEWTLRVAGSGEPGYVDHLKARWRDPRIDFSGVVDPGAFLSTIDVMVVPSLVPETFGLSAAEALAYGVPVVASRRGALPELVTHGVNGFLFDPDTPDSLAGILRNVLADAPSLRGMADACRTSVRHLAPGIVSRNYDELYRSVVS